MSRNVTFTFHAFRQMRERGISKESVIEAINKGSKMIEGKRVHSVFRGIEAVFIKQGNNVRVITVFRK